MLAVAAKQRGVVLTTQLLGLGLSRTAVARLAGAGRIHPLFRGAYSVDLPPRPFARELAALLLLGPTSVLSHRSSAFVLGVIERGPNPISVTVPGTSVRSRQGIVVHSSQLARNEIGRRRGLCLTSPARTALDLAATVPSLEARRAINELIALGLTSPRELLISAARSSSRRGAARLARQIEGPGVHIRTKYEGENRLAALLRRSRTLPAPERNVHLFGWEIDFLWPGAGFYVEVDGNAAHSTPAKFESDRLRDAELLLKGLIGQRVTWAQVTRQGAATLLRIERGHELARSRPANVPLSATK